MKWNGPLLGFAALWLGGLAALALAVTRLASGSGLLSALQAWTVLALGLDGVVIGSVGWWAAWTLSPDDRRVGRVAGAAARLGGYLVAGVPCNLFVVYYWLPQLAHLPPLLPFDAWAAGVLTVLTAYVDFNLVRSAGSLIWEIRDVLSA